MVKDLSKILYFDYAAATPVDGHVCQVMSAFLTSHHYANPSATHKMGQLVKQIVEDNRQLVAHLIGAESHEMIWTSGATESNNLALLGVAQAYRHLGNHIITVATEHESILKPCDYLKRQGFQVSCLKPNQDGRLDLDIFRAHITNQTILASVMLVNNETGVIQDIKSIAEIARQANILLHVDAAQAGGKLEMDVKMLGVNLMSLSGHKMYGPKGIGALYINHDSNIELYPVQHGGLQENGLRPGTLATHQIVGFGEACKVARQSLKSDYQHAVKLREMFLSLASDFALPNFPLDYTSPYIINIWFPTLSEKGRKLLNDSNELILSSRSACSNHSQKSVSHVLEALEFDHKVMQNSYRLSIGRFTKEDEIVRAVSILKDICGGYHDSLSP